MIYVVISFFMWFFMIYGLVDFTKAVIHKFKKNKNLKKKVFVDEPMK